MRSWAPWVRRAALLGVASLLVARAIQNVLSPDGLAWDFTNFYNTGVRVWLGEWHNIYRRDALIGGVPRQLSGTFDYLGPPISAALYAPLGAFEPRSALLLFKLGNLACYVAAFALLHRLLGRLLPDRSRLALLPFLALILVCEPVWRTFEVGGQSTSFAFLLVVSCLHLLHEGRQWSAAAALALAILVKPFLVVMPLVLVAGGMLPFVIRLGTCLVAAMTCSVLVTGVELHVEWLARMADRGGLWRPEGWVNASIHFFYMRIWAYLRPEIGTVTMPPVVDAVFWAVRLLVAALTCLLAARAWKAVPDVAARSFWVLTYGIFFALGVPPRIWGHYLLFLVPVLYLLLFRLAELTPPVKALVIGAVIGLLRASSFFAEELPWRHITVNSLGEVVVLALFASATTLLTLVILLAVDPVRLAPRRAG